MKDKAIDWIARSCFAAAVLCLALALYAFYALVKEWLRQ